MNRNFTGPAPLAATLVLIGLLGGCSSTKTSDRDLSFVSPSEAASLVQGRRRLLGIGGKSAGAWVDPRSVREYVEGHIPGAIHLPAEDVESRHRMLDEYDLVIVYGDTFNDPVALGVSKSLIELGHDARTLRGGLRAWEAAGNELDQGRPGDDAAE